MEVLQALSDAASQDPAKATASLQRLDQLHRQPGAFTSMMQIAADKSAPLNVRRIAIIQFKNHGHTNWRSRVLFTPENRETVKQLTTTFFDEADDTISQCNAIIIAKIFRYDTYTQWPQLIPGIVSLLQSNAETRLVSQNPPLGASLTLKRALYTLNQVLKEGASLKLPAGIQAMMKLCAETHELLMTLYGRFSSLMTTSLTPFTLNNPQNTADTEISHLLYKCLSKIMIWVWLKVKNRSPTDDQMVAGFFQSSASLFQSIFNLRINLVLALRNYTTTPPPPSPDTLGLRTIDYLTRTVRAFGKFFRRLQGPHAGKFVALPGCRDLVLYYWGKVVEANSGPVEYLSDNVDAVYPMRVLLQGMVLFKESLGQWAPTKKSNIENPENEVLSQGFVEDAGRLIVSRFLPLRPADLEKWSDDPEEWVDEELKDSEAWEYELRQCAERVLITLNTRYPQYVVPLLKATFDSTVAAPQSGDLEGILHKEALYCAIGRCYPYLQGSIPVEAWLSQSLAADIRETNSNYRILKRRIAWLLGEIGRLQDQINLTSLNKAWELVTFLLNDSSASSDIAVRISAAVAIHQIVQGINPGTEQQLQPVLPQIISGLMALIAEAATLESKTSVGRALNTVIEHAGAGIVPYMSIITEPIPQLWASAGKDYMFKTTLLVLMTHLVGASKEHSASLQHMVVPLVQESLHSEARVILDEDGIALWLAALRNATTIQATTPGGPALFDLLPGAIGLLADNLDLLDTILSIIDAYLLIDATSVLQVYSNQLHAAFLSCLDKALVINQKGVMLTLNLMVQVAPSSALWAEAMHQSGLFQSLLLGIAKDQGPTDLVLGRIHVFARIILLDAAVFLQLLQAVPQTAEDDYFNKLLDQWWRKFDSMAEPRHRKLTAMAMGRLVASGRPEVLKRLSGEIFNLWLDVLGEMKEALSSDDDQYLNLYWKESGSSIPEALMKDAEGTFEGDRRQQLYSRDPVQSTLLTRFLASQLQEAPNNTPGGPQAFQAEYLAKTDPTVLSQLQKELV